MTKANIKRHKESHIPPELRQVECDKCGHKFHAESVLKRHIDRVHNQLRTSVCQYCAKAFFDHHGLDKHIAHVSYFFLLSLSITTDHDMFLAHVFFYI